MDINYAKSLSYTKIHSLYKTYLQSKGLGRNTVGTATGDAFYLWNHGGKDIFWNAVTSEHFEEDAKIALQKALSENSSGNVNSLIGGYLSHLKKFRSFVYSLETESREKDDATVLKEFLLDIECLDPLAEWTSKFNLFDILKISRTEIRHSNVLSWLLNPNENHGFGDTILRGFIQYVVTSFSDDTDVFDTLLMDCHDFIIQREWHNIDILAVSNHEQFMLCIENKIDSGEHSNQLNRYRKITEENFPGYKRMYIYLSPDGGEASDPDHWCSMGYREVLNIVENAKRKVKLLPDAELLVNNYVDTIRRDIVGDEKLAQICAEIYAKHQKALDLIYENRPDRASELSAILKEWAAEMTEKGEIEFMPEKSSKSHVRFKTKTMSQLMPDAVEPLSGWGTKNYYFYEIRNLEGKAFFIQLSLSSKDIPDDLREMCDKINIYFPAKHKRVNWQWRMPFSTKRSKVDDEMSEDRIFEQMNKKLGEIKAFETQLVALLQENE